MPDRFLEADIVALENLLAVDSDDELLDLYVDVCDAPQSYKTRMAKDETKTAFDSTWF